MISAFSPNSKRLFIVLTLFFMCLAGCTTPPTPSHLPHNAQESALIKPDLTLKMSDGALIPMRFYLPPPGQKIRIYILALHGFNDSRDGWEFLAPALTQKNIALIAPDIRGFGGTQPSIRWSSAKRLTQDVREETEWLHNHYPTIPLYLMGESMGGALALLSAQHNPYLSGTILLAPAIMELNPILDMALTLWDGITPDLLMTESDVPGHHIATDNYPALRRLYFDPLTRHDTTIHALYGLTKLMAKATSQTSKAPMPLLVIFGSRDQFVPRHAYVTLLQNLPKNARIDELDYSYHLLSRDKNGVSQDIISWLFTPQKFLPSGGDFAAASWQNIP
ncbi:alpha/beta fold hydrolase [Aristophania vespae]|uniref:Alpha/beta fold hydrolase n=1 Tax=Aristophania vespae TaxID=2697033 RepID=A0A6P1NCP6_9PROT|nr:alpha/beta fold hydrolase [Aristophania vespae]QHI95273.1 alpha/beta fold hydrolase [Aristophania vespae]